MAAPSPQEEVAYQKQKRRQKEAAAEAARGQKEAKKERRRAERERRDEERLREYEERLRAARSQVEEEERAGKEEAAAKLERPAAPLNSISWLKFVAVLHVLGGTLSIIGGIVGAANSESALPLVIAAGAALSLFWMAALTCAALSVVQNVYGIHKKLDDKLFHEAVDKLQGRMNSAEKGKE